MKTKVNKGKNEGSKIDKKKSSGITDADILFLVILFTSIIMTISLLHQKWQQRLKAISKEHVFEVYGRFIPEEFVPGKSNNDSDD